MPVASKGSLKRSGGEMGFNLRIAALMVHGKLGLVRALVFENACGEQGRLERCVPEISGGELKFVRKTGARWNIIEQYRSQVVRGELGLGIALVYKNVHGELRRFDRFMLKFVRRIVGARDKRRRVAYCFKNDGPRRPVPLYLRMPVASKGSLKRSGGEMGYN